MILPKQVSSTSHALLQPLDVIQDGTNLGCITLLKKMLATAIMVLLLDTEISSILILLIVSGHGEFLLRAEF